MECDPLLIVIVFIALVLLYLYCRGSKSEGLDIEFDYGKQKFPLTQISFEHGAMVPQVDPAYMTSFSLWNYAHSAAMKKIPADPSLAKMSPIPKFPIAVGTEQGTYHVWSPVNQQWLKTEKPPSDSDFMLMTWAPIY